MEEEEYKIIKDKIKMDDILQLVPNTKNVKVFDFHKINNLGYPINIIITQRGSMGKTFNTKQFLRDKFLENGDMGMWIRSLSKDLDGERVKFLKELHDTFYKNCKFSGSKKSNTMWLKYKNQEFLRFPNINSAEDEKGSRIIYKYMIWDEFNVNTNKVNDIVNKFDSLLHSTEDIVKNYGKEDDSKIFLFGNYKSLNHPIIYGMGVTHITNDITEFYLNNKKFAIVICPILTKEQKKQFDNDNKNNWRYQLSKKMGTANHSYFNENLYDELNSVKQYWKKQNSQPQNLKGLCTIYHKNQYYNIYKVMYGSERNKLHCKKIIKNEKINKTLAYFQTYDVIENGYRNRLFRDELRKFIITNKITFENITTRDLFISSIK